MELAKNTTLKTYLEESLAKTHFFLLVVFFSITEFDMMYFSEGHICALDNVPQVCGCNCLKDYNFFIGLQDYNQHEILKLWKKVSTIFKPTSHYWHF